MKVWTINVHMGLMKILYSKQKIDTCPYCPQYISWSHLYRDFQLSILPGSSVTHGKIKSHVFR